MDRNVALKRLRKMLGPKFGAQINPKAASREEREEAKAKLPEATKLREALAQKKRDRFEAVLAADEEYQALKAACDVARKDEMRLSGLSRSYKITVGRTVADMFFSVETEGDSWEHIFEKLEAEKRKKVVDA